MERNAVYISQVHTVTRSYRKISRSLGWGALALLLIGNLVLGARIQSRVEAEDRAAGYERLALFTRVLEQIREQYVDASKTTYSNLITGALQGMLQSLDPHSQYLTPDTYKEMRDETSGGFTGVGIVVGIKDGALTVIAPMEDTPGFKAGLLPGDVIVEIDGESTDGMSLDEAVKRLRGPAGTTVRIVIRRPNTRDTQTHEIVRARINVPTVKDVEIVEEGIGYMRIVQFGEPTAKAVQDALNTLRAKGLRALVLDLRNNPGGLLNSAIEVAEKFVRRGEVLVYTQGRDSQPQQIFRAKGRTHYLDFPMVVLINGGTASAAEIVAGALQDHRRAVLVGERTFGKGSVQSVHQFEDGSAIRLTTAHYYTPNRRNIHEQGIEPDVVVAMPPDQMREVLYQRTTAGFRKPTDESQPAVRDIQLERAVELLKGILIYGSRNGVAPTAMR